MLDNKVEGLKSEVEIDIISEKLGLVIDSSLSEKKQYDEFWKEASKLMDNGEASHDLYCTCLIIMCFDQDRRKIAGQWVQFKRAFVKVLRKRSA